MRSVPWLVSTGNCCAELTSDPAVTRRVQQTPVTAPGEYGTDDLGRYQETAVDSFLSF